MIKKVILIVVILTGFFGLYVTLSNAKKMDTPVSSNPAMSIQTIKDDVAKGGQLIDVRTASEYTSGHIDSSINLSLQDIQQGTLPGVAKDKPVYVYCRSGNRSSEATSILKTAGYRNVIDLGAMTNVQSMGGKVTQ